LFLQKRLYGLALLAILPALAIQAYSGVRAYQQREAEARDEVLRLAQYAAGELDRIIETNRTLLQAMAELPAVRNKDEAGCRAYAAALAADYPAYAGLGVIDRDGDLLCASLPPRADDPSTVRPNFSGWALFKEVRASGRFTVSTLVLGVRSRRPVLPLTLPLKDGNGRFDGVASSGIDLGWLADYFAGKPLPPGGSLSIVDRNGTFLLRLPALAGIVGTPIRDDLRPLLAAEAPGTGEARGLDGVERLFGYIPPRASANGLFIAVAIGKEEAIAGIKRAAIRDGALLVLAVALALLAAWAAGQRFVRQPILHLAEMAERWRSGDLAARSSFRNRRSELGRLGTALDAMVDALQRHEQALIATIKDRDHALRRQYLLANEMNHRVKNTLTVVQSIAYQTLGGRTPESETLLDRLLALAQAHDLLTRESWEGARLGDVVTAATLPFQGESDRIALDGRDASRIWLAPQTALALALGLHELATNAAKYGALSVPGGRVTIDWRVEDGPADRWLTLVWRETGGPPVAAPQRRGFGSRLLERGLGTLKATLEFRTEGLVCTIDGLLPDLPQARWDEDTRLASADRLSLSGVAAVGK
jgi:two-component sensor histidine kinase